MEKCHTYILFFENVCGIIVVCNNILCDKILKCFDSNIMILGGNMIINFVIRNEAKRNEKMIQEYESLIAKLPKGSLICRKNEYYYLKYRKDGKVCDDYIGKSPEVIAEIRNQLAQRKHYEKMLSALKDEQRAIAKILEAIR